MPCKQTMVTRYMLSMVNWLRCGYFIYACSLSVLILLLLLLLPPAHDFLLVFKMKLNKGFEKQRFPWPWDNRLCFMCTAPENPDLENNLAFDLTTLRVFIFTYNFLYAFDKLHRLIDLYFACCNLVKIYILYLTILFCGGLENLPCCFSRMTAYCNEALKYSRLESPFLYNKHRVQRSVTEPMLRLLWENYFLQGITEER